MEPLVVLVHGYLCPPAFMTPLVVMLRQRGLRVRVAGLSPLCIEGVRTLAGVLKRRVDEILLEEGERRCVLVGVSQGGLIALWYLRHLSGWHRVRHFIALGTPFRGTWFSLVGVPILGAFSPGLWQTLPGSSLLAEIDSAPPQIPCTAMGLTGDPVAPPERCRLPGADYVLLPAPPLPMGHQGLIFSPQAADAIRDRVRGPADPVR